MVDGGRNVFIREACCTSSRGDVTNDKETRELNLMTCSLEANHCCMYRWK